jgi:hypothetical protein
MWAVDFRGILDLIWAIFCPRRLPHNTLTGKEDMSLVLIDGDGTASS